MVVQLALGMTIYDKKDWTKMVNILCGVYKYIILKVIYGVKMLNSNILNDDILMLMLLLHHPLVYQIL